MTSTLRSASDLLSVYSFDKFKKDNELTERGELLKEIATKTGLPIKRIAFKLQGMHDLPTLYYIRSQMNDFVRTGKKTSYLHAFNSCLYKPK